MQPTAKRFAENKEFGRFVQPIAQKIDNLLGFRSAAYSNQNEVDEEQLSAIFSGMNKPGLLITFEGIDGSGKTTQAFKLRDTLKRRGYAVEFLREPGGTKISEKIRRILLDRKNEAICDRTELLLYLAARAEVVDKVVAPAIKTGKIVIADRFFDSTYAYQIYGRGLPDNVVRQANRFAATGVIPDLTFLVDLSVKEAQERLQRDKDRLEAAGLSFQRRVRRGFLQLAQSEPRRIKMLDGRDKVEDIFAEVLSHTEKLIQRRGIKAKTRK
ncbi:MAG: dTMP kinase [bacterium]